MRATLDLTGRVYARLTVVCRTGTDKFGNSVWLCRCSCGSMASADSNKLRTGHKQSCGCLLADRNRELRTTHGLTKNEASPPTYTAWVNMTQRCTNPNATNWKNYGGRGITINDRWRSFDNFLADMGEKPPGKTLERRDNNKGYGPDNCCWGALAEQRLNKRNTLFVTLNGETIPFKTACEIHGFKYRRVASFIRYRQLSLSDGFAAYIKSWE